MAEKCFSVSFKASPRHNMRRGIVLADSVGGAVDSVRGYIGDGCQVFDVARWAAVEPIAKEFVWGDLADDYFWGEDERLHKVSTKYTGGYVGREKNERVAEFLNYVKRSGYDARCMGSHVKWALWNSVGRDKEYFDKLIHADAKRLAEDRAKREEKQRVWDDLRERFDGHVIGLAKGADVYSDGFSVRVVMRSSDSKEDRVEFLRGHRDEFLGWVMDEIKKAPAVVRKIGDLGFYNPVEITALAAAEAEVKFQVKGQ